MKNTGERGFPSELLVITSHFMIPLFAFTQLVLFCKITFCCLCWQLIFFLLNCGLKTIHPLIKWNSFQNLTLSFLFLKHLAVSPLWWLFLPPTPSISVISFCFNYSPAPTLLNKPALQEHDSHTHSDTNQLLLIETFTLNFKVFTVKKLFLDTQGKIPHLILLPIKTLFCF